MPERTDSTGTAYDLRDRQAARRAAANPDGSTVVIAGLLYRVESSRTGTASATNDLGVDGLAPAGDWTVEHFGATVSRRDNTAAFRAAAIARKGGEIFVPAGTWRVGNIESLESAGTRFIGDSKYRTRLVAIPGLRRGSAIFSNAAAASGTSAYISISRMYMDLSSQDITAVDLAGINNSSVRDIVVVGGTGRAGAIGIGIRFAAPLRAGAYVNTVESCSFSYLSRGVFWDTGGNMNTVISCQAISCTVGFDTTPSTGTVDTPRVLSCRVEGCGIGIREGAAYGYYAGLRSEGNDAAVEFSRSSDHPHFSGGSTASDGVVLKDLDNSDSPVIQSSDFGWHELEGSRSRPIRYSGRRIYANVGASVAAPPGAGEYAGYYAGRLRLSNGNWISADSAAGTNDVLIIQLDARDRLVLRAFDNGRDNVVQIGAGEAVEPIGDAITSLGAPSRRWSEIFCRNAPISTSDEREKTEIAALSAAELRVARKCRTLVRRFRWKNAVSDKGNAARLHFGVIAQDLVKLFREEGLDPFQYGIFCYDAWDEETDEVQKSARASGAGDAVAERNTRNMRPAGDRFGIRYDELLAFMVASL